MIIGWKCHRRYWTLTLGSVGDQLCFGGVMGAWRTRPVLAGTVELDSHLLHTCSLLTFCESFLHNLVK